MKRARSVKFEARIKELVETLPDLAVLVEPMLVVRRALEAVHTDLVFTISLKRSTQNLQLSTANDFDCQNGYQYQRPRPCNATLVTITVVISIMVTVVVMMLRNAIRRMLGMRTYTVRAIRRTAAFVGQAS